MMYNLATPFFLFFFFLNSCQLDSTGKMYLEVGFWGSLGLSLLKLFRNNSIIANEQLTDISRCSVLSMVLLLHLSVGMCMCSLACGFVYVFFQSQTLNITTSSHWLKTMLLWKIKTWNTSLNINYPSCDDWKHTRAHILSGNAVEMLICMSTIFKCPCVMTFTGWNLHFVSKA